MLRHRPGPMHLPNLKLLPKPLLACLLIYAILLAVSFWSAPYYPTAETPDLATHTRLTQAILGGGGRDVLLHGNTPVGLHFASALAAFVLQVGSLEALRIITGAVLLAIVSLLFFSAQRIFASNSASSIIVFVGSFVIPVDFIYFLRVGTYPNLLEDCVILSLLWLLASFVDKPSKGLAFSMSLLSIAGVFIHSSFFLFFAAVLISVPFIYLVASKTGFRNYLHALPYTLGALVLFAAVLWPFFRGNLSRIASAYIELGQPLLPSVLQVSYFNFSYDLGYFLGWVNVAALFASILIVLFISKKNIWPVLLLVWLGIQFLSPVFSEQSFRFVLFAMIPAAFIIGKGLGDLGTWAVSLPAGLSKFKPWLIPLLLLILILSGSLPGLMPKAINPYQRSREEAVMDSMRWLSQYGNCPVVASSGLWPDYLYLPALTPLSYTGDLAQPADAVLANSAAVGFTCIAVATNSPYFNTYQANPSYRELYHNNMVWIYAISH